MPSDPVIVPTLRRRIVTLDGRRVHLRHAGHGPRLLLLHGSPASSEVLVPLIEQLSNQYACLAPDTPGFGESDPLPIEWRTIFAVASATAMLLDSLGYGPSLVFGTHTGAAIELELAMQRPDLIGELLLDGVALFDSAERELFDGYFEPVLLDQGGGHFARSWTRIRDMFLWFPWTRHEPERLNGVDQPSASSTYRWVSMLYQASPHYAEIYRAAIQYTERALIAVAMQPCQAIYLARDRDMLWPHLSRLAPLKPADRVELTPSTPGAWARAVGHALDTLKSSNPVSDGPLPADGGDTAGNAPADQFIDLPHGQLRLRRFGTPRSPPLLLLHDAPGSGVTLRGLAQSPTDCWCVWVPDHPGCGTSEPLAPAAPTLDDYARSLNALIARLATQPLSIYGRGCGAAVGLALARLQADRVRCLILDELLIVDLATPPPDGRFSPRITLEADGLHWYRTWQRLRDSQIFGPGTIRRRVPCCVCRPIFLRSFSTSGPRRCCYNSAAHTACPKPRSLSIRRLCSPAIECH